MPRDQGSGPVRGTPASRRYGVVTMQDVARVAGVSLMTVSNVVNDHPHVKAATRARVLQAISELDYRVNVAARNLRAGRTGTIGLAIPEVYSPYFGQLAALIIDYAAQHHFRVAVEQTGAARENELDALARSRNRMYDGLILSAVGLGQADADLLRVDYPIVVLGERIWDGPVDHVAMPNVDAARAAVEHLIACGCRRIALLEEGDIFETNFSSLRREGYRQALEAAGIAYDTSLLVGVDRFSLAGGAAAGRRLLDSGTDFDGAFCVNDSLALGLLRALADARVRVPEEVKVFGFDNINEAAYSTPSLSTIDPDHPQMASVAVELLTRRIAEPGPVSDPIEFVSTFQVVARESTAH